MWIAPAPHSSWAFSTIREKALEKGNFNRRRKLALSSLKAKHSGTCRASETKSNLFSLARMFIVIVKIHSSRTRRISDAGNFCRFLSSSEARSAKPESTCDANLLLKCDTSSRNSMPMRMLLRARKDITQCRQSEGKFNSSAVQLCRRFAVMAGRRESLFRFGDADKDEGEWMRRRFIKDICVPLATRRYETVATCQTDRFDYSSPTWAIAASIRIR